MLAITEADDGFEFQVRVVPRASRTQLAGEMDGAVKVRVASPPVDGAANAELLKFLAKTLELSRSSVVLVSGANSKTKKIRVSGVSLEQLRKMLD